MPRRNLGHSIIALIVSLMIHSNGLAHGFTDKEWAIIALSYGKACGHLFPDKKAIYSEAIGKMKLTDSRLGPLIELIEKSPDQMKIVDEYSSELSQEKSDTEKECRSIEASLNK